MVSVNREDETEHSVDAVTIPDSLLENRYGKSPRQRSQNTRLAALGGAGFAVVLIAWLWWAGLAQPTAQFETRDLGWERVDEQSVSVKWEVSVAPGTEMSCAVQALNAQYGIVGWVIVDLPASEQRTRVFNQVVRTSETAVTGLLYRCWVP
jgi:hypothetical protein